MSRKKEIPVFELDVDEQSLLESFEKGEWRSVKSLAKGKTTAKKNSDQHLKERCAY